MSMTSRLAGVLFITTALATPSFAFAQSNPQTSADPQTPADQPPGEPGPAETRAETPAETPADEPVEISIPGGTGEIVVTGARDRNITKSSDQVVSILSTAEIARTGEGNIAGALSRVTGLSVVGSGYVYVRGLGDRYSLALLNGLPLPSPEPLRRVVPLDLFPSSVIASSLVQKSYSVNFPGEFGGGVINLTTKSVPRDGFVTISAGISGETETTGQVGYTYYGSASDWAGYDNGQRKLSQPLQDFLDSGVRLSEQTVDSRPIAGSIVNSRNGVIQRWKNLPANFTASVAGGKAFDLGSAELGVIATAGYSNKYQNRQPRQQISLTADLSELESDFLQLNTDQRIVVNGLLGLGLKFDGHQIRFTTLYIHDTIKQARLSLGHRQENPADVMIQKTGWYERQLLDTQLVGEFELAPGLKLDLRGSYANSKRDAPYELQFEYVRSNSPTDIYGDYFINVLNRQRGDARATFSKLNENLWSAGIDLSYQATPDIGVTLGGAFNDTHRTSSRREFFFNAAAGFIEGAGLLRPDLLLAPNLTNALNIELLEADEGNPAFDARMRNWAGYLKVNAQITSELSLDAGVRLESARQSVSPIQVFTNPGASTTATSLQRDYWLPAATVTWQFRPDMQFRISGSKTIARPQFRELLNQPYFDPDTNRSYRGNPLLVDSQLYNAEARYEWYFAPEQRLSFSGFYKRLDRPIEAFVNSSELTVSYANAPKATLYGFEAEVQKHFDLSDWGGFFNTRRLVVNANYTFTKSSLEVRAGDTTAVFGASTNVALDYFQDGAPLTGQSDHIANLQIGFEHMDKLSQQTILLSYASNRVTSRGLIGLPDIIEKPGLRIDFVAREDVKLFGRMVEFKFEARNLTGQKHEEFQQAGANRIEINTYDVGRTFSLSATLKF